MQEGVGDARATVGVAATATLTVRIRVQVDDRLGLALAAFPQELDLVRIQHVADHDETVPVEDPDRVVDFIGPQDLEARHSIAGFQVASQRLDIHGSTL